MSWAAGLRGRGILSLLQRLRQNGEAGDHLRSLGWRDAMVERREGVALVARQHGERPLALGRELENDGAGVRLIAKLGDVPLLLQPRQVPAGRRDIDLQLLRDRAEGASVAGGDPLERVELLERQIATADLIAL